MIILVASILVMIIASCASILGVLTGLGGGVLLTPLLLLLKVDIHSAMAASLISIMALSLTTAITHVGKQNTNIKIGIFLETAAVIGAIVGAFLTSIIPKPYLALAFSVMLFFSVYNSYRRMNRHSTGSGSGSEPSSDSEMVTEAMVNEISFISRRKLIQGWGVMSLAGTVSGILGIGLGILKVLAMDQILNLPYRISTATSNFMVGMTVAASIGIYFQKGYVDFALVFPVILGSMAGSIIGSFILLKLKIPILRSIFIFVIGLLALQMFYKGITGILGTL